MREGNIDASLNTLNTRTTPLASTDVNYIVTYSLSPSQSFNTPGRTGMWYCSQVSGSSPTGGNVYGMLLQLNLINV